MLYRHLTTFTFLLSLFGLPWPSAAAGNRPAVVELFTSQGCDSCPAADAFLGELAKRPDVIALAYHVTYHDGLGWTDRFGLPDARKRQEGYARALSLTSIYTPQMVVDGVVDLVGSDRPQVLASLGGQRTGPSIQLSQYGGRLEIEINGLEEKTDGEIWLVGYSAEVQTKVTRGENAGKTLTEYSIVRSLTSIGAWDGSRKKVSLDLSSLPTTASKAALLIQAPGQGPIIGAAMVRLER